MRRSIKPMVTAAALLACSGATPPGIDPNNPTCPAAPNWSDYRTMVLTPIERKGVKILLAEGRIDSALPTRLEAALAEHPATDEIWIRSPGGNARAGNAAGLIIRKFSRPIITRIPSGWACFSACNFMFMGGRGRIIDPGGQFMVHMFTMTGDRGAIESSVELGADATKQLISEIEQDSALLSTEDNDLMIRLFISRKLLSEVMYRQKALPNDSDRSTRRCLSTAELVEYNVINARPD